MSDTRDPLSAEDFQTITKSLVGAAAVGLLIIAVALGVGAVVVSAENGGRTITGLCIVLSGTFLLLALLAATLRDHPLLRVSGQLRGTADTPP